MWSRFGFAFERFARERRQVNSLRRVEKEKRFVRILANVRFQKLLTLFQEHHVDFF